MMKKNHAARLGALALALTLVSTCLMGGTLAKYTTTVTGTATATVAKWSFKANEQTATINEIKLGDTLSYNEKDINKNVIAPGTEGSFDIKLDGTGSEVGIDYAIEIAKGTAMGDSKLPSNLVFSTNMISGDNKGKPLTALSTESNSPLKGTINYNDGSKKKTITIYWKWPYDTDTGTTNNDTNDTTDSGIGNITLDITVTGTQVVPETTESTT